MANTILKNGIVIPEKGINSWYEELANNYTLIDNHLGDADKHLNQEEKNKIDTLSNVASTGDYNDLNNKPTIPSKVSELINDVNFISGVSWEEIDSKPLVYTPDTHTHVVSDITDLNIPTKTSDLDNDCDYTTTSYVDTKVANLVSSAPETLDTLNELASALGNDPNFATTIASQIGNKANSSDVYTKQETDTLLSNKASTVDLATVATTGSYNDLTNKPTIPTVNNATLTIQKNGTTVKTFTANSSANVTCNIEVPTKVSQLTNDSGFIVDVSGKADKATTLSGYGITDAYTKTQVDNKISGLVNSAPETLDTLNELANALGNDPNFATTVATQIGTKANNSDVVHKRGNETIAGSKTFTGRMFLKSSTFERGNLPSNNIIEDREFELLDKNNKRIFSIMNYYFTDGNGKSVMYAYNPNTTNYNNLIGISFDFDNVNSQKSFTPNVNDEYNLGTPKLKWKNAYATAFHGNLVGNADSATKATQDSDGNQINTTYSKNGHTHDDRYYTETEVNNLLNGKANDADVVHKGGDETISGIKNFNNVVLGEQDGVIRIGGNGEGALFCTLAYNGRIYNISKQFVPTTNNEYNLGTTSNKWKTLNGINPGALSFPSNNRIDILSTLQSGGYTAPSNGYVIAIKDVKTECASTFGIRNETIGIEDRRITERVFFIVVMVPVKTGEKVIISDDWNSIGGANVTYSASFYPCSGNV